MTSIAELCLRHGTDKATYHRYAEVYDTLLARHRRLGARVLEIGVLEGASILAWADAFPNGTVWAIDTAIPPVDWPRHVHTIEADAYDVAFVDTLPGPFDVIIDDGSHTEQDAVFVARHYAPLLAPGGTLVIEDVLDPASGWVIADALPPDCREHAFMVDRAIVAPQEPGRASRLFVVDLS